MSDQLSFDEAPRTIGASRRERLDPRPWIADVASSGSASRWALLTAVLCFALIAPTVIAAILDSRQINGSNVWLKPFKFQLSTGLHFLTLAILLRYVGASLRDSRFVRWPVALSVVAALAEVFYIMAQAARGRASHFNDETAWEALAYGAMAMAAVVIVAGSFIAGLLILIRRPDSRPRSGVSLGAGLGLVLGSIGTLVVGAALGSGSGHWIGGEMTDASGLPLVGWSTTGGDLRVPHFFATHAMQVLPLFGLVADKAMRSRGRFAVPLFAVAYGCVVLATYLQAKAGIPFLG